MAVGLGWLQDEYDSAGVDMRNRGARMDEQLMFIGRLFQQDEIAFAGKYYKVAPTRFEPRPCQRPRPPFLIGGVSEPALRRAARCGWVVRRGERCGRVQKDAGVDRELPARARARERALPLRPRVPRRTCLQGAPSRSEIEEILAEGADRAAVTPWGYDYADALVGIAQYAREVGLA